MKKIVLVVTAMMAMTFCYAETEDTNSSVVTNVENYDMSFDLRRLAVTLGLTFDQMEAVRDIQDKFNDDMMSAAAAERNERSELVDQAIRDDVRNMHYVLDKKQFHDYLKLLGTTLHNKGLK